MFTNEIERCVNRNVFNIKINRECKNVGNSIRIRTMDNKNYEIFIRMKIQFKLSITNDPSNKGFIRSTKARENRKRSNAKIKRVKPEIHLRQFSFDLHRKIMRKPSHGKKDRNRARDK